MLVPLFITLIVGYGLGSLPFGYLVARLKGVKILEVGSKNPGATNVKRVLGAGAGNTVFVLDFLKGLIAVVFAPWIASLITETPLMELSRDHLGEIVALVGAVLGHSFSLFLKFRGGKGVATAGGGLLVLLFVPSLIAILAWVVTFYSSRYVSLASIVAALVMAISPWLLGFDQPLQLLSTGLGLLVIIRHHANIRRLRAGTEHRWDRK